MKPKADNISFDIQPAPRRVLLFIEQDTLKELCTWLQTMKHSLCDSKVISQIINMHQ